MNSRHFLARESFPFHKLFSLTFGPPVDHIKINWINVTSLNYFEIKAGLNWDRNHVITTNCFLIGQSSLLPRWRSRALFRYKMRKFSQNVWKCILFYSIEKLFAKNMFFETYQTTTLFWKIELERTIIPIMAIIYEKWP